MNALISLFRNVALLELYGFQLPMIAPELREYLFETHEHRWNEPGFGSIYATSLGSLAFLLHLLSVVSYIRSSFRNIFVFSRSRLILFQWYDWVEVRWNQANKSDCMSIFCSNLVRSKLMQMMDTSNLLFQLGCAQFLIGTALVFDALSIAGEQETVMETLFDI